MHTKQTFGGAFMIQDTKLVKFTNRVADLPDEPVMSAAELKACFDACPEELRIKHNDLISNLFAADAAGEIGFARTTAVPADTVHDAVTNVQKQLQHVAMGAVPNASIEREKLSESLNAALDHTLSSIDTLGQTTQNLQNQVSVKTEIVIGTYSADNADTKEILLGFEPKAIIVNDGKGRFLYSDVNYVGGMAILGGETPALTITQNGFMVYYNATKKWFTNRADFSPFSYIAFK